MRILTIGFGEAGRTLAASWRKAGLDLDVATYDLKLDDAGTRGEIVAAAGETGVRTVAHDAATFASVEHVLSLVTPDQALAAARDAARFLSAGHVWWDMNSASPETKRRAAEAVAASGANYLDVGVLAPVRRPGHRVTLAVAGRTDDGIRAAIEAMDLNVRYAFDRVGEAAALKLLRSVAIKGIESVLVECRLACRKTGLTDAVLETLPLTLPGVPWEAMTENALDRVEAHGERRAAEMREAASFLDSLGVEPLVSRAAAVRLARGVQ